MVFTSGYWRRGTFQGLPLRWHWSVLAGLFIAGDFGLAPLAWLFYLGLIQCHLMAHGLAVKQGGMEPIGFDVQGLGGKTRWRGHAHVLSQVRAAWAGVAGQLVPMIIAKVILVAHGGATASWLVDLERVCIEMNAVMIGVSLLPLPTFDGEVAWKIVSLARGTPIEARRVVVMELDPSTPSGRTSQALDVAEEVAREVRSLARTHNDRAGVG
jgi:hypothetical protein